MLLAGDIGGTKINLAVFAEDPHRPLVEATFYSADYNSLEAAARAFLSQIDLQVNWGCFGVAGPVVARRARVTNLPWEMEETQLAQVLDLRDVHLLNDLEAIANAVPILEKEDLLTLNDRPPAERGAIAIVAPGTGLGEAFLTWNGTHYEAFPSEGGHTDFAPADDLQIGLLRYLQERYGHVSWERVCSGLGLPNVYAYLKHSGYAPEPPWLADELSTVFDATPVIVGNALDEEKRCALCVATLELFVSILGAEAGNLALKTLATGGVYLGGGIPPRIIPALRGPAFLTAFQNKGRFSELLARLPVHVILNAKAALLGAARYGLQVYT